MYSASTQTLLSHSTFSVLLVIILEHRSVSGCSEPDSLQCWDSS